jgi:hypothetical protein
MHDELSFFMVAAACAFAYLVFWFIADESTGILQFISDVFMWISALSFILFLSIFSLMCVY